MVTAAVKRLARRAKRVLGRLNPGPTLYRRFGIWLGTWSFDWLGPGRRRPPPPGPERIGYVLWRYPTLTQTFVRREVQALREAGVALWVFALEPDTPPCPEDPESPAGPVIYYGPNPERRGRYPLRRHLRRQPWTVFRLWLFVVRQQYRSDKRWWQDRNLLREAALLAWTLREHGITHVHSPWADRAAVLALLAARLLGATFSVQARASEIHRDAGRQGVADRTRFADFVVTNSRYNVAYLRALLGTGPSPRIETIYNGVELSRFRPVSRPPDGTGPLRLLGVGRLIEPKGFRYLLLACRLLRDRGVQVCCEIIGGPQDPLDTVTWVELRKLHTELALEPEVRFRGAQPFSAVLAAYQRADVFVLPCVRGRDGSHDITPNSVLEAMASGLPVVSTTSGAVPEIVAHELDGLLVPPNDAAALAAAIERLGRDPELRVRLGAAARRTIESRFDIARNVARRVELFRMLRSNGAGASGA